MDFLFQCKFYEQYKIQHNKQHSISEKGIISSERTNVMTEKRAIQPLAHIG